MCCCASVQRLAALAAAQTTEPASICSCSLCPSPGCPWLCMCSYVFAHLDRDREEGKALLRDYEGELPGQRLQCQVALL